MAEAPQSEHATFRYDAMLAGRGGEIGNVVETVAYRSSGKLYDVLVFDVHRTAPCVRAPSCLCPRRGEGTMERAPLAATAD